MKKKYALVIADVEMNIVTDASWESVEKIVGILDRKMRDINLKSPRCTKNQAALLCALEYCADKLALQERNLELEELADQDGETIEKKDQRIAELEAELAKLQGENEIMHNILERAAASTKRFMGHNEQATAEPVEQPAAEQEPADAQEEKEEPCAPVVEEVQQAEPEVKAEEEVCEPEQLSVVFEEVEEPVNTKAAQVIEEIASKEAEVTRVKVKKTKSRSRVGSMFDLLTFNDV